MREHEMATEDSSLVLLSDGALLFGDEPLLYLILNNVHQQRKGIKKKTMLLMLEMVSGNVLDVFEWACFVLKINRNYFSIVLNVTGILLISLLSIKLNVNIALFAEKAYNSVVGAIGQSSNSSLQVT